MTRQEKFKEINCRIGNKLKNESELSVIQIIGYLKYLVEKEILRDGQYDITDYGENILALLSEFDWKATNAEIFSICEHLCGDESSEIATMLVMLRDDKEKVEKIIDLIIEHGKTGEIGDGKIFIYDIADAVRIRTGERGESAI
jgi:hypothetical protein